MWIPGSTFGYVEADKKTRKRRKKTARLPLPKGNAHKVITRYVGSGRDRRRVAGVAPVERVAAAQRQLAYDLPRCPEPPLTGAVLLVVDFVFEPAASWPIWRKNAAVSGAVPCVEHDRGDLEQLGKLLCDALEDAGWLADDCTVDRIRWHKRYGREQGYLVEVWDRSLGPQTKAEWLEIKAEWGL